jgi:flagellar protein FliO/FliZ
VEPGLGACAALAASSAFAAEPGSTPKPAPPAAAAPAASAAPAPAVPTAPAAPPAVDDPTLGSKPSWETEPADTGGSVGWQLVKMMASLGIVLLTIYVVLNYGVRRLMGLPMGTLRRSSVVTVLERIPLDQKKAMFVLKAGGEYLLVGGSDGGLSLICKLDAAEVERIEREKTTTAPTLSPFLQKLMSRRGGSPPPSA